MASMTIKKRSSARRCLFPCGDRESTKTWLNNQLEKIRAEKEQRWGFDFASCSPIENSDWIYEPISAAAVPEYYRHKTVLSTPSKYSNENRTPAISPSTASDSSDASDVSMDLSEDENLKMVSPKPVLPKKRRHSHDTRVSDYFKPTKKRSVERSSKLVSGSSSLSQPTSVPV